MFSRHFLFKSACVYPSPVNLNFSWCFGFLTALMLVIQLVTGVILALHYSPTSDLAFDSLRFIMRNLENGWLVRYCHMNGASFFFIAIYLHIARNFFYGSFMPPRRALWTSGLILFILLLASAFFGYVLPWGQMSYWGTTVISGLVSVIPLVGNFLLTLLWSGDAINSATLHRFFTLHFLTPFLLASVALFHVWLLHEGGSNMPLGFQAVDFIPLHSYYTYKDGLVVFFFLFAFIYVVFFNPHLFSNPVNSLPADVVFTPKQMVPEWYFLPLYTILRSVSSRGGGLLLVVLLFVFLFTLPSIAHMRVRNAEFQFGVTTVLFLLAICYICLGWCGAQSLEAPWVFLSRFFTCAFYLLLFIVLPLFCTAGFLNIEDEGIIVCATYTQRFVYFGRRLKRLGANVRTSFRNICT